MSQLPAPQPALGPEAIAGVTLRAPRPTYSARLMVTIPVEPAPFGMPPNPTAIVVSARAELRRAAIDAPLTEGTLVLTFSDEKTATFKLADLAVRGFGKLQESGGPAFRALLVGMGILGRPELLATGQLPLGWDAAIPREEAQEIHGALRQLHYAYYQLTRTTPAWNDGFSCAECAAAFLAAQEAARNAPPPPAALFAYRHTIPTRVRTPPGCEHRRAIIEALGEMATESPELMFEMLGWIEPVADRFVLSQQLVRIALGHWLLGKAPEQWDRERWALSYIGRRRPRRSTYAMSGSRWREPQNAGLTAGQRSALTFAAETWGMTAPIDSMLPPSKVPAEPVLDLRERVATPRSYELPPPEEAEPTKRARKPAAKGHGAGGNGASGGEPKR